VAAATLAALIRRVVDGTCPTTARARCSTRCGRAKSADVDALIEAKGLKQMNDSGELEAIVDEVIAANAKSVEEFRAGKDKAFNAGRSWSARS
jgi:aspartyl-tRNA(Asn)/glutamyl-tRNA(Gln) amidotransferase subunit B